MMRKLLAAVAVSLIAGSSMAATVTIYSDNFDGSSTVYPGISGGFGFYQTATANGAYAGSSGKLWSGSFIRNVQNTNNPGTPLTFTFNNLPEHDSISIDFMLGFLDSWDSLNGAPSPDELYISIGGSLVATLTTANASGSISNFGGGTQVVNNGQIDTNFFYSDDLVDMATAGFLTFAHTGSTLTFTLQAGGAGWQGGADEGWGVDSIRFTANTTSNNVPEPGTLALLGLGLAGLAATRRRRR